MGAFTYLFVNILGWFSTFYGFCLFVGLILDSMNSLPFRPKLFIAVWAFIGAGALLLVVGIGLYLLERKSLENK